jgi:hypothetical protein
VIRLSELPCRDAFRDIGHTPDDGRSSPLSELQGPFMLCNAVLSIELIAIPVMGDLIVAAGYFGWFHR